MHIFFSGSAFEWGSASKQGTERGQTREKKKKKGRKKPPRLTFLDLDDTGRRGDGILRRRRWRRDAVGDVPERAAAAALGARRRGPRRAPRLGAHLVLLLLGASRRWRRPGGPCGRRGGAAGGGTDPGALRADGSALAVHPRQGPAGPLEEVRIFSGSLIPLSCSVIISCADRGLVLRS